MKYLMLAYTNKDAWDTVDMNDPEFIATWQRRSPRGASAPERDGW